MVKPRPQGHMEKPKQVTASGFGASAHSSTTQLVPASVMKPEVSTQAMLTQGDIWQCVETS